MSPVGWLLSQCDKLIDMTMSLFTVISLVLCHFGHIHTQYYYCYYYYVVAKPFKKTTHTLTHNTTQRRKIMVWKTQFAFLLFLRKTCVLRARATMGWCLCVHTWVLKHPHIAIAHIWRWPLFESVCNECPTEHFYFKHFPNTYYHGQYKTSQAMACRAVPCYAKTKTKPIWYMLCLHPNQSFFFLLFATAITHVIYSSKAVLWLSFSLAIARLDIQIKYTLQRR